MDPAEADTTPPREAYKQIIDTLVQQTPTSSAQFIQQGQYTKGRSEWSKSMNAFVQGLTVQQRADLIQMLNSERQAAMGEVLTLLTWWADCRGLAFTLGGAPLPIELSGMGMHGDYVGRLNGWDWPS